MGGGKVAAPVIGEFLDRYLTEENYNKVRDAANEIKELNTSEPADSYSYRDSQPRSIFRNLGTQEAAVTEVVQPEQSEQLAQPVPPQAREKSGGGFFDKIFKRKRR